MQWLILVIACLMQRLRSLLGYVCDGNGAGGASGRRQFALPMRNLGWNASNLMLAEARVRALPHIETPMSNGPPQRRGWTLAAPESCSRAGLRRRRD